MRAGRRRTLAAPPPDPFGEHRPGALLARMQLLGGRFEFTSDSARLLRIVHSAYAGLPPHKLPGVPPRLRLRLVLTGPARSTRRAAREPPPVRTLASGGILCGAIDGASFVTIDVPQRAALIVVARDLLRYAYHIRYELLEFAAYVLAARVQGLAPLHAGCVGHGGQGILILGASGSGKSTLVLQCLLSGLDLLAEDSVLVTPQGLLATGVASFLHLRADALRFLDRAQRSTVRRRSAVIRRRSGVEKLEIDLRCPAFRLAATPLRIGAVVFLSSRSARGRQLLLPLRKAIMLRRLAAGQRYAARQPGWSTLRRRLCTLPAYELRRGQHPRESVAAVRALLEAISPTDSLRAPA